MPKIEIQKPKNTKVCMVAYAFYFTDARIKAYVNSLLKKGILVDVLSLKEPGKKMSKEMAGNLEIYYLTTKYMGQAKLDYLLSYIKFFIFAFFKLSMLWIRKQYQIIHVHNMPNFILFSAILPRLFGTKIILDMHDIVSQNFLVKFKRSRIFSILLEYEERMSAKFANEIICADDFQRRFLINERKIYPNKIRVIMNFPDTRIFRPHQKITKDKKDSLKIVYHGTITHRLGIDIILNAIAKIRDTIKVRLFLYGTGDYLDDCLRIINQKGLNDIIFASKNFFSVEDLSSLLYDKDLGIIGLRKTEATKYRLPVKLLEYMAMGIPVVAPQLEGIECYLSNKEICFYEPENIDDLIEKIIYLYKHPQMMMELSENAYRFIRKHTWHEEVKKYLALVANLCRCK